MTKRKQSIDFAKGILILLMIIGHMLPGSIAESPLRFGIYSFHMPLFLGISGMLIKRNTLMSFDLRDLWSKYQDRLIIPFLIAFVVYYLVVFRDDLGLGSMASHILAPYKHLWFVPSLLLFILFLFVFRRIKQKLILFVTVIVTLISLYYIGLEKENIIDAVLTKYKPHYLIFFFFGYYLRNYLKSGFPISIPILLLIGGSILQYFQGFQQMRLICPAFYLLNLSLILIIYRLLFGKKDYGHSAINWFGINSLAVYLWHVLFMMSPLLLGMETEGTMYYVTQLISLGIMILLILWLNSFPRIKRILFGL